VRTIASPAIRWVAALAAGVGGVAGTAAAGLPLATPAFAATNPTSPASPTSPTTPTTAGASVASLQTQAQELAGRIEATGRTLDELDASYQAAQIQYARLTAEQARIRTAVAAAQAAVATARRNLTHEAVVSYMAGGSPTVGVVPDRAAGDPSVTLSYSEIVAARQQDALQAYRTSLASVDRNQAALDATTAHAAAALATIKSDAAQAAAAVNQQRQDLAQVKGQLAVLVAQAQARKQAAEQAQERAALAAQGDLPPATPTTTAPPTTATSRPAASGPHPTTAGSSSSTVGRPAAGGSGATSTTLSTSPPTTAPARNPSSGAVQAPGADRALAYARAQLGKPYQWGGAGPDSFDCSGLVMMAWAQAGIYFPHLAQDQYDLTGRIPLSALVPGDLVFFGTPDNVYHVGIYIGSGDMIDAPETGQNVSVQSIFWDSLLGAGRVTSNS